MTMERLWNVTEKRRSNYWRKACPRASPSTKNLTWTGRKSKTGVRSENLATNRPSNRSASAPVRDVIPIHK